MVLKAGKIRALRASARWLASLYWPVARCPRRFTASVDLAPAFAAAAVRETQQLEAEGKSPERRGRAHRNSLPGTCRPPKGSTASSGPRLWSRPCRLEQPLRLAAYVATVTTHHNGKATVWVERLIPPSPMRAGGRSSARAACAHRQGTVRLPEPKAPAATGQPAPPRSQESARIQQEAVFADFVSTPAAPGIPASFAFTQEPIEGSCWAGSPAPHPLPPQGWLQPAAAHENATNPGSMLGGSVKMDH